MYRSFTYLFVILSLFSTELLGKTDRAPIRSPEPTRPPVEYTPPKLKVVEGIKREPSWVKNGGVWERAWLALIPVLDGVSLRNQQSRSILTCPVHSKPGCAGKCNGDSKDCPYGNYWFAHRIEPIREFLYGFVLLHHPDSWDLVSKDHAPAQAKREPLPNFVSPHDIYNAVGSQYEGEDDDDNDRDAENVDGHLPLQRLLNHTIPERELEYMASVRTTMDNFASALLVLAETNNLIMKEKELRAAIRVPISRQVSLSIDQLEVIIHMYLQTTAESALVGKDFGNFFSGTAEIKRLVDKLLNRMLILGVSDVDYRNLRSEIESTWFPYHDIQNQISFVRADGLSDEMQEYVNQLEQRGVITINPEKPLVYDLKKDLIKPSEKPIVRNLIWGGLMAVGEGRQLVRISINGWRNGRFIDVEINLMFKGRLEARGKQRVGFIVEDGKADPLMISNIYTDLMPMTTLSTYRIRFRKPVQSPDDDIPPLR